MPAAIGGTTNATTTEEVVQPSTEPSWYRFEFGLYAGAHFIDIITQPGLGPLRGSVDFLFRDDSLNARNAFQPAKGPEQTQQYTMNLSGTLRKERTSFSLSATGAAAGGLDPGLGTTGRSFRIGVATSFGHSTVERMPCWNSSMLIE